MQPSLTRRSFLLGAATVASAAACSKGSGVIKVGGKNSSQQLNLIQVSGPEFYSGVELRLGFGLAAQPPITNLVPGSVTLQFGTDEKQWGPATPAVIHSDAGDAPTYLSTTYRFPRPGTYWVRAGYQGRTADAPIMVTDPSAVLSPIPGRAMPSVATPTVGNHRGVEPICTRSPMCPWHDVSLDTALSQSMPVVLLFATPLLCETRFCGPVLDTLLQASAAFAGKVRFLHSEIFTEPSRASANTPAVLAYHLQSEPVLILANAKGVVTERIDGLFGQGEAVAALTRLTGS